MEAKITDFVKHDFKLCLAIKMRMKGAKPVDIGELVGNKSLIITERCAHLGKNQLYEVATVLNSDSTTITSATNQKTCFFVSFLN